MFGSIYLSTTVHGRKLVQLYQLHQTNQVQVKNEILRLKNLDSWNFSASRREWQADEICSLEVSAFKHSGAPILLQPHTWYLSGANLRSGWPLLDKPCRCQRESLNGMLEVTSWSIWKKGIRRHFTHIKWWISKNHFKSLKRPTKEPQTVSSNSSKLEHGDLP